MHYIISAEMFSISRERLDFRYGDFSMRNTLLISWMNDNVAIRQLNTEITLQLYYASAGYAH